jgi:hypothetical protein
MSKIGYGAGVSSDTNTQLHGVFKIRRPRAAGDAVIVVVLQMRPNGRCFDRSRSTMNEQNRERRRKKNKEQGKTSKVAAEGAVTGAGSRGMLSSKAEQKKEKAKEKAKKKVKKRGKSIK